MARHRTERGLYLTMKMSQAYPHGFCGAIITGSRGVGKSSFALNAVWELFRELENPETGMFYTEDEAWEETLKHCKFTMDETLDFIERNIDSKNKAHCLIWDDAGTHASTLEWWENRSALKRLKSITDTIRTGVCSLILTTPSESDLTKFLRNYDDYIVQIGYHSDGGKYRVAKGYLKRTLPSGGLRIYPKFKNRFYVYLPDWVFEKYMKRRNAVLMEQTKQLKEKLEEQRIKEELAKWRLEERMKRKTKEKAI